jgi:hypothetical protein
MEAMPDRAVPVAMVAPEELAEKDLMAIPAAPIIPSR